jgi:hypothetical protein
MSISSASFVGCYFSRLSDTIHRTFSSLKEWSFGTKDQPPAEVAGVQNQYLLHQQNMLLISNKHEVVQDSGSSCCSLH